MILFNEEQAQHVSWLFERHERARRDEMWDLTWTMLGCFATRDTLLGKMRGRIDELEAELAATERAFSIVQEGHSKLYQQAQSTPRTINSAHVRKALIEVELQLKELAS